MAPAPITCEEKRSLLNQLKQVIIQILSIHEKELEAVALDDFSTTEWTVKRLTDAHELKAVLVERLWNHLEAHGCAASPSKEKPDARSPKGIAQADARYRGHSGR